ncbi:MAG TPA: phospholipase D-like domain-containing protein [Aliidongia sp.]|nr:phospholipase D-like domain-containing protein [Aliidongia sp.]
MLTTAPLEIDRTVGSHRPHLLLAGVNCWRRSRAARAALLTNADYFRWLADSLKQARHRILLVGWDLDAALVLDPRSAGPEALPLAEFLQTLLERNPALEIRFLLWDRTTFYGGNRLSAAALAELGARHARFRYHYLPAPLACSHHAKLVVIDDTLAFVGGIDLAGDRWDRTDHPPSHPARVTPAGDAYGPIHDLQMLVAGPAAADLADYAASRWAGATGEPAPGLGPDRAGWPDGLAPDFTDMPTGIARTEPAAAGGAIREVEALNHDALAAARQCIYLEAQYLTAATIGDSLVRQLQRADGPEIVIIVTRTSHGFVEQFAMGNNRDRLLRRLVAADRWGRLRVYYPTVPDGESRGEVKIHAKLAVIDDRLLRIGSSNLNNRSMAVDTECDLAFEATGPRHRDAIRALRHRLVAEQLHRPVEAVAAAFRRTRSLIAVIDGLNGAGHLQPLLVSPADGSSAPMTGTALLDPSEPLTLGRLWCELGLGGADAELELRRGEHQAADGERD